MEHVILMIHVEECWVSGDVDLPSDEKGELITRQQIALHPADYRCCLDCVLGWLTSLARHILIVLTD